MRWAYFIPAVLAAMVVQTTVGQVLWFRTSLGWIGPELLACVAVFVALNVRNGTDAALAGWALGLGVDVTLSGEGMGLLPLLYAAGCGGLFGIRDPFYRARFLSQMALGLMFCLFVYQLWTAYDVLVFPALHRSYGARILQAAALAAYTAVLTPLVGGLLRKAQRQLVAMPDARGRR